MSVRLKNAAFFGALVCLLALPALSATADRTSVKPGWNLFTTQQDIDMGRALADEAERTLVLINQPNATTYIDALGKQLAAYAPGTKYPYQFKIIDDDNINMYALPGGFIYVSRGLIEAAQNEPELAGALAHEIAHVVLRHGTAEVSQAYVDEVPNATRGRANVRDVMSRLNIHFDPDSIVLNYSREDERQADILATQIMADARFDPRQMSNLFQALQDDRSNRPSGFFINHPEVTNRAAAVRGELQNLGGVPRNPRGDSPDFHSVKDRYLVSDNVNNAGAGGVFGTPDQPSSRMTTYQGRDIEFRYPENWRVSEDGDSISIAPDRGFVNGSMAYGMTISIFQPQDQYYGRNSFQSGSRSSTNPTNLSRATDQLLDHLRESNPNMTVAWTDQRRRVDGRPAMAMQLTNDSPLGGRETDWLVTVMTSDGSLRYFVGVAPENDFSRYQRTFEDIVASVRLDR
jgi:hypothetical protein